MQATRTRKRRSRARGRPASTSEADVRGALLDAAGRLFLKHGFDRVSARAIAAEAGATPAMIHYYYENKLGLFRAILERAIEPFRQLLVATLADEGGSHIDVPTLVQAYMRTSAANPWIATLIVNEVLAEPGRLRTTFSREIAGRLLPMLVKLIERGRDAGKLRPDLDPKLTALSLVSVCIFPFISRPVVPPLLGLKLEGEGLDDLIDHTSHFVVRGIASAGSGEARG